MNAQLHQRGIWDSPTYFLGLPWQSRSRIILWACGVDAKYISDHIAKLKQILVESHAPHGNPHLIV